MRLVSMVLGGIAALSLACASPAEAAKLQQFWVHNFSHLDIYQVYALQDRGGGTRDLMGENGHLDYKSWKVPDSVLVLAPNKGSSCYSDIQVVGFEPKDENGDREYDAYFSHINLCVPGQSVSVFDQDFE